MKKIILLTCIAVAILLISTACGMDEMPFVVSESYGRYTPSMNAIHQDISTGAFTECPVEYIGLNPSYLQPRIFVFFEGVKSIDIYDSEGNRLVQDDVWFYREKQNGTFEKLGDIFLREDLARCSIIWGAFSADEFTFRNIVLVDNNSTCITVLNTENGLQTYMIEYLDITKSDNLELRVSPNNSQLSDTVLRSVIEPTAITCAERSRQIREEDMLKDISTPRVIGPSEFGLIIIAPCII